MVAGAKTLSGIALAMSAYLLQGLAQENKASPLCHGSRKEAVLIHVMIHFPRTHQPKLRAACPLPILYLPA